MTTLVKNEFYRLFRRRSFQLLPFLILTMELAAIIQKKMSLSVVFDATLNGQSFFLAIMSGLQYIWVISIVVFVADIFIDDYMRGTLINTFLRSVNRASLLHSKLISMFVFVAMLVTFSVLTSYLLGTVAFGWGEHLSINGVVYNMTTGIEITLKSALAILPPLFAFGMLIVLICLITSHVGITFGIAFSITLISQMIESSVTMRQYSIVYQIKDFYLTQLNAASITDASRAIVVIIAYTGVSYLVSALIFTKKNLVC